MPKIVESKYFSDQAVMDDSLSDFREKKKYNSGPKKTRNIKKPKRTRGQKDIRTLIKKQENDVLSYSKDFDKVCKQAGLDVDSEDLQLAIALSKSLKELKKEENTDTESKVTEHLTSQQRTLKIKTTLQEYGFRVPKAKITDPNKRKRYRKPYKLLLISEAERHQLISDKYSEVLAGNIFNTPETVLQYNYKDKQLYYKTTNICYDQIKQDDVFYVTDLFDKPVHKTCLLRDWSEIPGRPVSPTVKSTDINFDDITCNQHELNCILSGSISAAQQIIRNKKPEPVKNRIFGEAIKSKVDEPKALDVELGPLDNNCLNSILTKDTLNIASNTMSVSQVRCISPDLFDDDTSTLSECPGNNLQTFKSDNIHTYCMDLTECVNMNPYNNIMHTETKLHDHIDNTTNRKSNDFMEITDCVSTGLKQTKIENIDLTQSPNDSDKQILSQNDKVEVMDLTKVPDDTPPVQNSYKIKDNSLDNTLIVLNDDFNINLQQARHNLTTKAVSGTIYCTDDIIISEGNSAKQLSSEKVLNLKNGNLKYHADEDSNTLNKYDENNMKLNSGFEAVKTFTLSYDYETDKLKDDTCAAKSKYRKNESSNENITLFQVDDHSSDSNCKHNEHSFVGADENTENLYEDLADKIDLTQSSNSSKEESGVNEPITNYSTSLGKRDNVSIDYDEICDDVVKESDSQVSIKSSENHRNNRSSTEKESNSASSNNASNPSKSSEVFEISDKEFNYSLHQFKHENFDLRDVSAINNFSNFESISTALHEDGAHFPGVINRSLSESNSQKRSIVSPLKKVTQSQEHFDSVSTPIRVPKENIKNILQTPKNGEYIIKTNEVTPMLDYESMSSPERHKELEKYGLKPFKRKRAIQLLTYLYNQTHPIVESSDDYPSPSKRQKKDDTGDQYNSPKKTSKDAVFDSKPVDTVPEMNHRIVNKENDLYAVTNEQPDIKTIACDPEDWIFQNREKAKLHSCRVPLHVAFHNYVSCRRRLRDAILRYEPVNIDVIHKDLVATGYRYNPKDLLKFMDRKCITVRTADSNARNRKS